MIIKLPLMLHNIISKQFKISHVPCQVIAFNKDEVPSKINKLIVDQYDEKFLDDSDIVIFVKGPIDKKMRDKIFKACDKALGEGANMLNNTDFKLLKLKADDEADFGGEDEEDEEQKIDDQVKDIIGEPDETAKDVEDVTDDSDDNGDAVNDALETESINEDDDSEDDEEDEESDDEDKEDEEDDEKDDDQEDDSEESNDSEKETETTTPNPIPTRYVFLKVSMKK